MDRGAWWATVHGITELDMSERLMRAHTHNRQYIYLDKINQGKIEQPGFCQLFLHCGVDTQGSSFGRTE